jgi:putative tryptophan/tyrosine transport system substrate-binding protein
MTMRRRQFIAGLGSAAAWPVVARAQQRAMPVVGYLDAGTLDKARERFAHVQRGLSDAGYVEGQNMAVEYRCAEDHSDRLPALADDLVRRRVAVIVTLGTAVVFPAKAATKSIPIVFATGTDPVETGLVASLNRPGGNLTGIYNLNTTVVAKRLELLHELVPTATSIAYLVNPTNPIFAMAETRELQVAARTVGVRLLILKASDPSEFEAAFTTLVHDKAGGVVVSGEALFSRYSDRLVELAARHEVPAIYSARDNLAAGGLMSYGTDLPGAWRQVVGVYAGRILKGEKPADLPVQQVTKLELVINLKTAKALGLTIPETLLATADEVIQ